MTTPPAIDPWLLETFAGMAVDGIGREYPNQIVHAMESDADLAPPRVLTPAFYGSFDWHSAVHGHWMLVRMLRFCQSQALVGRARLALAHNLTAQNLEIEARYMDARPTFERPYGLAWLLQLDAELHDSSEPEASQWRAALQPVVRVAVRHLRIWLERLTRPVRTGVHSQTAFAMGLALDWARRRGDASTASMLVDRSLAFHGNDHGYALHLEPSGEDFLSPSLGAADLMRRVLAPAQFSVWLGRVLPQLPRDGRSWLAPAVVSDPSDGRLVHLDGLNLSRAFMLEGIAAALGNDERVAALQQAAAEHSRVGLVAARSQRYTSSHWLGTFAIYLLSRRGLGG